MDKYELKAANTAFRFFIMPLTAADNAAVKARADISVCQPVSCERQNNGRSKMTTATKNATIYYSIDGGEYQQYASPLIHNEACTVTAYCAAEGMIDSPKMTYEFSLFINKSAWKLVSADSYQGGNEPRLAFDNNTGTFWHTAWGASEPPCPHTIIVDMVNTYNVTAFTYLTRQDGNQNGMVKAYEVYLSLDGQTWGKPVANGEFKNTTALQTAKLSKPTAGRYLKFVAKSEVNGNAWTSAAEIGIEADADVSGIRTPQLPTTNTQHPTPVYDLQGRLLGSNIQSLPHGVYINKGKKVVKE
jgi:beta-galactosidase